jgi:hypothetical protein
MSLTHRTVAFDKQYWSKEMSLSPIHRKLSLCLGIVSCAIVIASNYLVMQDLQKILIENQINAEKITGIFFSNKTITSAAIALLAPTLLVNWIMSALLENARKLDAAKVYTKKLVGAHSVPSKPNKAAESNPFHTSLVQAYDNLNEFQKIAQRNTLTMTQSLATANSLNDLCGKLKQKVAALGSSFRELGPTISGDSGSQATLINEVATLASTQSEKLKETITALTAIKTDLSTNDLLIKRQSEIIGTKIQSTLQKNSSAGINLTSICEKFYAESIKFEALATRVTSDLIGAKSDPRIKESIAPEKTNAHNPEVIKPKETAVLKISAEQTTTTLKSSQPSSNQLSAKTKTSENTRGKNQKAQQTDGKEKILALQVEERKIPLRSDSRFEDL